MRFSLRIATISLLLVLAGGAAMAQFAPPGGGEVSLAELLREDGTVDTDRPKEGTVDLSGFDVFMHADGTIRAIAEGDWLPGEQSLGLNGYVAAMVWGPDGALYVGGVFSSAGGLPDAHGLARWMPTEGTGGTWSGLGFTGYSVNALTWGPDGALYVGGSFDSTGGVEGTRHIARWTPSGGTLGEWTALGAGLSSVVYSLAWGPDGALYVGGLFPSWNDDSGLNRVARWTPDGDTGGEWSPLGSGTNGTVRSLAWGPDGNLYVGGQFSDAGGVPGTNGIARWTPSENKDGSWSALGEGVSGGHSLVNAASALTWGPDGALYVGGGFASASGVEGTRGIARWTPNGKTGGEWSALGQEQIIGEGLSRIRTLSWGPDGSLYVGGQFQSAGGTPGANHIARWNPNVGSNGEWSALGPGVSAVVHAIVWGSDGLYVGGEFINAGGIPGTSRIARWTNATEDAGAWNALGTSLSEAVYALAWGPDGALYVGGLFTSAGGVQGVNRIARWTPTGTGGTWTGLGAGANALVYALSWGPDGALYAGGHFSSAGGVPGTSGIARWTPSGETGGTWSALGTGVNSWVNALSWGPDGSLYVGGTFTSAGGVSGADRIARWIPTTGTAGVWSALGTGTDLGVWALAWGPDGSLYAGGSFTSAGGVSGTRHIARWTPANGTGGEWSSLGSELNARVWALAWGPDDALYAGGEFTSAGGVSGANRIARWTIGGDWGALGPGLNGRVRVLSWGPDGALYAGGGFTSAGDVSGASYIAQWHPSVEGAGAWRALGMGTNNGVLALNWGPEALLHVGGLFSRADGAPSSYVARWKSATDVSNEPAPTAERFAIRSVHPNPFRGLATITLAVPEASPVRIELFDMLGRLVSTLEEGNFSAGVHEISLSSDGLAPAVYLVRLIGSDYAETRRVTVVR